MTNWAVINGTKIAAPGDVAKLMFAILTLATDSSYNTISWDYRNPAHHNEVNVQEIPQIRSRL